MKKKKPAPQKRARKSLKPNKHGHVKRHRPSKLQNAMEQAEKAAELSHDAQTQVGCVLVSNTSGAVLMNGYNGFVRGAPDEELPNTRPEKYDYMMHSEENLIANCARHGVSTNDCKVICTMSPCVSCMRLLFQSGITQVIVKDKYTDFKKLKAMKDLGIVEKETPEGYTELTYIPKKMSTDSSED